MEMEALRQYQVEFNEFKQHFELVSKGQSIAFGEYRIMKNTGTGQAVLVKPQETQSLSETEELLTTISEINIKLNECQHFLQFLGFTEVPYEEREAQGFETLNQQGNIEESPNMIYLVFEYFENKLEDIWIDLINQKGQKIEDLLLRLAQTLGQCFGKLEEIGQNHTDVSLQNILAFKSEQDGLTYFKLIYSQYTTSAFRQVVDHQQNSTNYFLAPELLERLDGRGSQSQMLTQSQSGLDPQKIDVYAFGQMLKFLAALQDPSISMGMKERLGRDQEFSGRLLKFLKDTYSQQFYQLVTVMTDQEMAKRPSFSQINVTLQSISFLKQKSHPPSDRGIAVNQQQGNHSILSQSSGYRHHSLSAQQANQILQLENIPLQNRAQEIRQELFSKNKQAHQQRRIDRSSSQTSNNGIYPNTSNSSYLTPGRFNNIKKSSLSGQKINTPQRFSYSPVSHSPYQQRARNSNSQLIFPYQNIAASQNASLHFKSDVYQSQSRISPSKASPSRYTTIQELYNQEFFVKMLIELERNTILDGQDNILSDITKKEYQDGSVYMGEIGKNELGQEVRQGKGIYYYKNQDGSNKLQSLYLPGVLFGEVYAGDWKSNLFHGNGVYLFSSGERYQGELKEGQKCGQGIYYYQNGNQYDGEWADDLKNGYGHFYFNCISEKYEGHFLNGQRHGTGEYTFSNGDIYQGEWEHGEKSGHGEVQFSDGTKFEGEWKSNQPNGHGKMLYPNGDIYEGNFTLGMKDGDGVYIHKNANSKYEGTFKADEPMGYGQFFYGNNDVFEGEIKSGQRHGRGAYSYVNGDKYEGEWKFDKKSGMGIFSFSDGSHYEGNWNLGQIKGQGVMNYANGDHYKGEWLKDKKHGKGHYKWNNGNSYKGDWRNDKITGKGIFISKEGKTFASTWLDNKIMNKI